MCTKNEELRLIGIERYEEFKDVDFILNFAESVDNYYEVLNKCFVYKLELLAM